MILLRRFLQRAHTTTLHDSTQHPATADAHSYRKQQTAQLRNTAHSAQPSPTQSIHKGVLLPAAPRAPAGARSPLPPRPQPRRRASQRPLPLRCRPPAQTRLHYHEQVSEYTQTGYFRSDGTQRIIDMCAEHTRVYCTAETYHSPGWLAD